MSQTRIGLRKQIQPAAKSSPTSAGENNLGMQNSASKEKGLAASAFCPQNAAVA